MLVENPTTSCSIVYFPHIVNYLGKYRVKMHQIKPIREWEEEWGKVIQEVRRVV